MHKSDYNFILLLMIIILNFGFLATISYSLNFVSALEQGSWSKSTTNGVLNVQISPSSDGIAKGDEIKFKIEFFDPKNGVIQVHVDYDFIVSNQGKEVFSASKQIGQQLLHTAEGVVTIPYTFSSGGSYTISVPVLGINFIPINPEYAEFEFNVT